MNRLTKKLMWKLSWHHYKPSQPWTQQTCGDCGGLAFMQYSSIVVGTTTPSRSASACDAATCFLEKNRDRSGSWIGQRWSHERSSFGNILFLTSFWSRLNEPLEVPHLRWPSFFRSKTVPIKHVLSQAARLSFLRKNSNAGPPRGTCIRTHYRG